MALPRAKSMAASAILALSLVGCKTLSDKLGVPVNVEGSVDRCMNSQYWAFDSQYGALTKAGRVELRETIQSKYKQIVIHPTTVAQTISGTAIRYNFVRRVCGGNSCWDEKQASKLISNQLAETGTEPETLVSKEENLEITMQASKDESVVMTYKTYSAEAYDKVEDAEDPLFLKLRQEGVIKLVGEDADVRWTCSENIVLKDNI